MPSATSSRAGAEPTKIFPPSPLARTSTPIPNAGKYDGVVGVLGAIEAIRTPAGPQAFNRSVPSSSSSSPPRNRPALASACLGRRLLGGVLSLERAAALRDRDGKNLEFWPPARRLLRLARLREAAQRLLRAFVELQIEQGPILEAENLDIGVVEKSLRPAHCASTSPASAVHAGATAHARPPRCPARRRRDRARQSSRPPPPPAVRTPSAPPAFSASRIGPCSMCSSTNAVGSNLWAASRSRASRSSRLAGARIPNFCHRGHAARRRVRARARHRATGCETADAKRVGSLGGEDDELDGTLRLKACGLQGANGFNRASTPTTPSYLPALGMASMCEPVATAGRFLVGSAPAREDVADGIRAQRQAGGGAKFFDIFTSAQIGFGE